MSSLSDSVAVGLRRGVPGDVPAMLELDLVCFEEPFRFDLRSMRRFATQRNALSLIAEGAAGISGFVIVHVSREQGTAYVVTLDVHPAWRRQGLARRLMLEAERECAGKGCTGIRLHVSTENAGAIRFYEGLGYADRGRQPGFYGARFDACVFAKALTAPGVIGAGA